MKNQADRKIILEDGREFYGQGFGSYEDKVCEIVFNTSMAGYQEILSDPSYTDQAIVMTYPLIGNYGMAADDYESKRPSADAMIVREYNDEPSNFRSEKTLGDVMASWNICGVSGIDTRSLTRSIRDYGTRKALITDASMPLEKAMEILRSTALPSDAVSRVSCREKWISLPTYSPSTSEPYLAVFNSLAPETSLAAQPNSTVPQHTQTLPPPMAVSESCAEKEASAIAVSSAGNSVSRPAYKDTALKNSADKNSAHKNAASKDAAFKDVVLKNTALKNSAWNNSVLVEAESNHIVAIDCGMKMNIVRSLNRLGCRVTVVPWNTPASEIRAMDPDGILISNGPGNPEDVPETIAAVKSLIGSYPIFGICLGHQILSLAYGAKTYKLKFGHRGGNHPVKNLLTGKIEITSQNHSYAVEEASLLQTPLTATHINLLDQTIEGVRCEADRAFAVQYHPESSPGPQDSAYLFDRFLGMIRQ